MLFYGPLCFNHRFKFKALELNRKILDGVEGLKKPAVKEPTVPEGFELQIEKRLQERQATKPQEGEEKLHIFKSQPIPKKILEGVVVSNPGTSLVLNTRIYTKTRLFFLFYQENIIFTVVKKTRPINRVCQRGRFCLQLCQNLQLLLSSIGSIGNPRLRK